MNTGNYSSLGSQMHPACTQPLDPQMPNKMAKILVCEILNIRNKETKLKSYVKCGQHQICPVTTVSRQSNCPLIAKEKYKCFIHFHCQIMNTVLG